MQNFYKTFPDGKTMPCGKRPNPLEGKVVVITGFYPERGSSKAGKPGGHSRTQRDTKD